jgi:hypothetical protein
VFILHVYNNSAATKGRLIRGDIILADSTGIKFPTIRELNNFLLVRPPNEYFELVIARNGTEYTAPIGIKRIEHPEILKENASLDLEYKNDSEIRMIFKKDGKEWELRCTMPSDEHTLKSKYGLKYRIYPGKILSIKTDTSEIEIRLRFRHRRIIMKVESFNLTPLRK